MVLMDRWLFVYLRYLFLFSVPFFLLLLLSDLISYSILLVLFFLFFSLFSLFWSFFLTLLLFLFFHFTNERPQVLYRRR